MINPEKIKSQLDENVLYADSILHTFKNKKIVFFPMVGSWINFSEEEKKDIEKKLEKLSAPPFSSSLIPSLFDDLNKQLGDANSKLARYKNIEGEYRDIKKLEDDLKTRKNLYDSDDKKLKKDLKQLNNDQENLKEQQKELRNQQEDLRKQSKELANEKVILEQQKDAWKQRKKDLNEKIEDLESDIPSLKKEKEKLEQQKNKLTSEVEVLKTDTQGLSKERDDLSILIFEVQGKRVQVSKDKDALEREKTSLEGRKKSFETEKFNLNTQIAELKINCADLNVKKESLRKNSETLSQEIQLLDQQDKAFQHKFDVLLQKTYVQKLLEKFHPNVEAEEMDWFVKIFLKLPVEFIKYFISVFSKREALQQQDERQADPFLQDQRKSPASKSKPDFSCQNISNRSLGIADVLQVERLPNAKKGQSYCANLKITSSSKQLVNVHDFDFKWENLQKLGLSFDAVKCELRSDEVLASGDEELDVLLLKKDTKDLFYIKVPLTINPDPRDLWQDLPADEKDPYFKKNQDVKRLKIDTASLLFASIRGRSHAHKGTCRDDDAFIGNVRDWSILLVADGVGSKQYSRKGSQIAVETAGDFLRKELASTLGKQADEILKTGKKEDLQKDLIPLFQKLIPQMCETAIVKIENEAASKGVTSSDYATTFLATLVHKDPVHDSVFIVSFWIGDGAIAIYSKKNGVYLMGQPDSGEYAGQTRVFDRKMFKDKDFWDRLQFKFYSKREVDELDAVLLMTDGISDPYFKTDQGLTEKRNWDVLWSDIHPLLGSDKALVDWMGFFKENNHDDRTIAVLKFK